MTMFELFVKGGPIMWPILILSVITLAVVGERILFSFDEFRRRDRDIVQKIFDRVQKRQFAEAISLGRMARDPIAGVLAQGIEHRDSSLDDALLEAASRELDRYNRGLVVLDTAVTLGPLLGLLGTVIGMMRAFGVVGAGDLADKQQAITGGIAESLLAVAFGLIVAIVAILPLNYFSAKLERARRRIEAAMNQLTILLRKTEK
jgi:biopolymer transport protein ExbB